MINVSIENVESKLHFVKKTSEFFHKNPHCSTYGDVEPGSWFAVKWGMDNDCILVFKIDPDEEIENYCHVIDYKLAQKYTEAFRAMKEQLAPE